MTNGRNLKRLFKLSFILRNRFHLSLFDPDLLRSMEVFAGPGQTPSDLNIALIDAAKNGDVNALKAALESGANPNYISRTDEGGPMPLHHSVKHSKECTALLLESGASANTTLVTNSNTPLHEAASIGADDICGMLISKIEENNNSDEATSPSKTIQRSISKKNCYGNTPLFSAVRRGSVDTVRLLLDHGAEVNAANHLGSTVLHLCAFLATNIENSFGANKEKKPERRLSRLNRVEPHLQIAAIILSTQGFEDIDCTDANGHSALHIASQRGCIELVKVLVDSGASLSLQTTIDYKGRGGRNAAQMAKFAGMTKTYELLNQLDEMKKDDIYAVVTKRMCKDLEGGYSMSNPVVGSGAAVRRRSSRKS